MYNDCWPSNSWSVVDYYANPKAGWYAFKNSCSPTVGSIHREEKAFVITVMNDGRKDVKGSVRIALWNVQEQLPEKNREIPFYVSGNETAIVSKIDWELPDENYLLVMDVVAEDAEYPYRTVYFPKRIADLNLPSLRGEETVRIIERSVDSITLHAEKYTHMVDLDGDYIFEDNYFTMLPGETRTVKYTRTAMAETTEIYLYSL